MCNLVRNSNQFSPVNLFMGTIKKILKILGIILGVCIGLILLINLIGIITNIIVSPQITKYRKEAEEFIASLKVEYRKPQLMGSSVDGNAYDYYKKAIEEVKKLNDHEKNLLHAYLNENKTDSIPSIKRIIKLYKNVLENLDEGVKRAFCIVPIDYRKAFEAELPPILALTKISNLNLARAKLDISKTEAINSILTNFLFGLDIGSGMEILLNKMASFAIIDKTNNIITQMIPKKELSSALLKHIADSYVVFSKNIPGFQNALEIESTALLFTSPIVAVWYCQGGSFKAPPLLGVMVMRILLIKYFFSESLVYLDALKTISRFNQMLKETEHKQWQETSSVLKNIEKNCEKSINIIVSTIMPSYYKIFLRKYKITTAAKLIALAAFVENYRLKNKRLPENLIEVVLDKNLLVDPFSNGDLKYAKTGDSYMVYSVGENLTDDSGTGDDISVKIEL